MYSHDEIGRERSLSRHFRMGPFFKGFLISILIEVVVLFLTLRAFGHSMMSHSGAGQRTPAEELLSGFALIFHLPSLLIVTPLGLFMFAPVVQVALMTGIIGSVLRART